MSNREIKIMVVDDHPGIRELIKQLLVGAEGLSVVGEADNGLQAVEIAGALKPDLILLDMELPILRGDAAMREIRLAQPDVKVLVISSYSDAGYIQSMLENGASGYITKDEVPDLLLKAIYGVFHDAGSVWMSAQARRSIGRSFVDEQTLTKKEADILSRLLAGQSDAETALALAIDVKQVSRHLELLMRKFEATNLESLKNVARRILPPQANPVPSTDSLPPTDAPPANDPLPPADPVPPTDSNHP